MRSITRVLTSFSMLLLLRRGEIVIEKDEIGRNGSGRAPAISSELAPVPPVRRVRIGHDAAEIPLQ